jgi:hypothetical protein
MLKDELECLLTPLKNPLLHQSHLRETLDAASKTLDQVSDRRCIVVITPDASELEACTEEITTHKVHIVCSGAVPLPLGMNRLHSWLINATPAIRSLDDSIVRSKSVLDSLQDMINFERAAVDAGEVTNVRIYVEPGKDATLDAVIGDLVYSALKPGQLIMIPVKVNIQPLMSPKDSLASRSSSQSSLSSADAFAELEMMLGEVLSELFTVEVHYNHSFLPANTDVVAKETCWVLRTNSSAEYSTPSLELKKLNRCSQVHGHLAHSIASTKPRREALSKLNSTFGSAGLGSHCPEYLELLRAELKFQIGVMADEYILSHIEQHRFTRNVSPALGRFSFENRYNELLEIARIEYGQHEADGSPKTVIHRPKSMAMPPNVSKESPNSDQARRI